MYYSLLAFITYIAANFSPHLTLDINDFEIKYSNKTGTGIYEHIFYVIEILETTNKSPFDKTRMNMVQFKRAGANLNMANIILNMESKHEVIFVDGHKVNDNNDPNDIFIMNTDVNFMQRFQLKLKITMVQMDTYIIKNTVDQITFITSYKEALKKSIETDVILTRIVENDGNIEIKEMIEKTLETIVKTEISFQNNYDLFNKYHVKTSNGPILKFSLFGLIKSQIGEERVSDTMHDMRSLFLNGNSSTHSRRESFTLRAEIHVKPFTRVSITGFIKTAKDMELHFQAVRTFTASDLRYKPNTPLNGLTLYVLINKYEKQHDMIVNNNSVTVNQNGIYRGTFGIETYTQVRNLPKPPNEGEYDITTISATSSTTTTPVTQTPITVSTPTITPAIGSQYSPPIDPKTSFSLLEMSIICVIFVFGFVIILLLWKLRKFYWKRRFNVNDNKTIYYEHY